QPSPCAPLLAHRLPQLDGLGAQAVGDLRQLVEHLANLAVDTRQVIGQAHREVTALERPQGGQELPAAEGLRGVATVRGDAGSLRLLLGRLRLGHVHETSILSSAAAPAARAGRRSSSSSSSYFGGAGGAGASAASKLAALAGFTRCASKPADMIRSRSLG